MIVITNNNVTEERIEEIVQYIEKAGVQAHVSRGTDRTVIGIIGKAEPTLAEHLRQMKGVENVIKISKSYKLASRDFHPDDTVIEIKGVKIGGEHLSSWADHARWKRQSRSMRSRVLLRQLADRCFAAALLNHVRVLTASRALASKDLLMMAEAGKKHGLLTITEVMTPEYVDVCAEYADILQVGTRNMQNFDLLRKLGTIQTPVLLKRGFSATYDEFLNAAEYILAGGNPNVMLCERGIRTFETYTRNTLDLAAIPVLQSLSHLAGYFGSEPRHGTTRVSRADVQSIGRSRSKRADH